MTEKGCTNTVTWGCVWIVLSPLFIIISLLLFDNMFLAPLVFIGIIFVAGAIGAVADIFKNGKNKGT